MSFSFFMKKRPAEEPAKKIDTPKLADIKPAVPTIVEPVSIEKVSPPKNQIYAFIDASNLFWGGKESLGFGINYFKLMDYLRRKHKVTKVFYYSGVVIYDFEFSILDNKAMDLGKLEEYLTGLKETAEEKEKPMVEKAIAKVSFYKLLEGMGYVMKIKPAKVSYSIDDENMEKPILKANCDVDMTFDIMRLMPQYSAIVAMTGDGDFAMLLSYLKSHDRKVTVISRWDRTAKEIKQLADDFVDFSGLKHIIQYHKRG